MKKLLISIVVCFLSVYNLSAQDQTGLISVAGNLSYGTKMESLGVGLRGQYGFTDNIRGSIEYKYYIDRRNWSAWMINTDLHYVFSASDVVSLYPIAGVSISRWTWDPERVKIDGLEKFLAKTSESRFGMNLGFGSQIAIGHKSFLQIEAKEDLIKNYSQFVISVGFMYQF